MYICRLRGVLEHLLAMSLRGSLTRGYNQYTRRPPKFKISADVSTKCVEHAHHSKGHYILPF